MKLSKLVGAQYSPVLVDSPVYMDNHDFMFYVDAWFTCRDTLLYKLRGKDKSDRNFYFKSRRYNDAIKRVRLLEKKLKIKRSAEFYATHIKNTVFVKPGLFWNQNSLRMSTFSALIKSKSYFKNKKADKFLKLFSKGYTLPTRNYWCECGVISNINDIRNGNSDVRKLVKRSNA